MTDPESDHGNLRFAWYRRLSTDELQQPQLAFPSQRAACERRVRGIGRIVCEFTDVESGRSDDRAGIEALFAEAAARIAASTPSSPTKLSGSPAGWSSPSRTRRSFVSPTSRSTSWRGSTGWSDRSPMSGNGLPSAKAENARRSGRPAACLDLRRIARHQVRRVGHESDPRNRTSESFSILLSTGS